MRNLLSRCLVLLLGVLIVAPALAVMPDEKLDDPELEARARVLSADIRCLVCQNESIDSSNADLARELRLLVRERLVEGDSDQEVLDYLVSRYGDFVLLTPPFKTTTLALWIGPVIFLLLAVGLAVFYIRRQAAAGAGTVPVALSDAEDDQVRQILTGIGPADMEDQGVLGGSKDLKDRRP